MRITPSTTSRSYASASASGSTTTSSARGTGRSASLAVSSEPSGDGRNRGNEVGRRFEQQRQRRRSSRRAEVRRAAGGCPAGRATCRRRCIRRRAPALEAGGVPVETEVDHGLDAAAQRRGACRRTGTTWSPRVHPTGPRPERCEMVEVGSAVIVSGRRRDGRAGARAPTAHAGRVSRSDPGRRTRQEITENVRRGQSPPDILGVSHDANVVRFVAVAASRLVVTRAPLSRVLKPSSTIAEKWTKSPWRRRRG